MPRQTASLACLGYHINISYKLGLTTWLPLQGFCGSTCGLTIKTQRCLFRVRLLDLFLGQTLSQSSKIYLNLLQLCFCYLALSLYFPPSFLPMFCSVFFLFPLPGTSARLSLCPVILPQPQLPELYLRKAAFLSRKKNNY